MGIKRFPARPRAAAAYLAARLKRAGQVTVELLLVLPVFMLLLFFIMEMGNLGFHTILAHHCAYEMARVGSLVAGPNAGNISSGSDKSRADEKMGKVLEKMFPSTPGVKVESSIMQTLKDPQSEQMGEDLLVTLTYPATLVFPGSSYVLSDPPRQARKKKIIVKVRMPIEKPYYK